MIFQGYGHCLRLGLLGFLSVWSNVLFCQGFEGGFSSLQSEYECASQEVKMPSIRILHPERKNAGCHPGFWPRPFWRFPRCQTMRSKVSESPSYLLMDDWQIRGRKPPKNLDATTNWFGAPCWFVKPRWFFFCHNWNTSCKCSGRNGLKMLM